MKLMPLPREVVQNRKHSIFQPVEMQLSINMLKFVPMKSNVFALDQRTNFIRRNSIFLRFFVYARYKRVPNR